MKTNQEIQSEAQHLMVLGRQYRDEHRNAGVPEAAVPLPRLLLRLPVSVVTTAHNAEPESESVHTHRRDRFIEAAMERDELIYRLMEQETETTGSSRMVREAGPSVVTFGDSAYDALRTGYELAEEERLGELLTPYAERIEGSCGTEPAGGDTVAEVEAILETNLLPPGDRIRAKSEIAEFLEGRLEASAFIAHAIERHCSRDERRERLVEQHQIKLRIDEP
ncbi:MAG: hypothetical protein ABIZ04_02490 [Opitutus sp.]